MLIYPVRRAPAMGGGEPVSRFWACFFSPGIFALLWTTKMRVTRKWLLAIAGPWAMPIVVAALVDEYKPAGLLDEVATAAMVIGAFGIPVFATAVPFMFKWATEYNTERFGHASRRAWKEARRAARGGDAPAGAGT